MGDLFGGGSSQPTIIQAPQPPAPIPSADPNDPAIREAKLRTQAQALTTGGRASTLLTAPKPRDNPSSFDSYASKTLGGAS